MIRVVLPFHLRKLAGIEGQQIELELLAPVTISSLLSAIEAKYPMLRGTIREYGSLKRRPFIRFFACEEDLSHVSQDTVLPEKVISGAEPFYVVGAMAGG